MTADQIRDIVRSELNKFPPYRAWLTQQEDAKRLRLTELAEQRHQLRQASEERWRACRPKVFAPIGSWVCLDGTFITETKDMDGGRLWQFFTPIEPKHLKQNVNLYWKTLQHLSHQAVKALKAMRNAGDRDMARWLERNGYKSADEAETKLDADLAECEKHLYPGMTVTGQALSSTERLS